MIIVGLTGGIGSGKSTIADFFEELGVPIYEADSEAKVLMNSDERLKSQIISLLGNKAYENKFINKEFIASKVFSNKRLLSSLNKIVHPAVETHFKSWVLDQKVPYVIKEAAILFENGGYLQCDFMILVTAPKSERIKRVKSRDKISEKDVIKRMDAQWTDILKKAKADVLIENVILEEAKKAAARIHTHIMIRLTRGWYKI